MTFAVTRDTVTTSYRVTATAPTPVNLTNHTYLNLDGPCSDGIDDHLLTIDSDQFTPVTAELIPTGEVCPVAGTSFDLRTPTRLGDRVRRPEQQIRLARGIDHHFDVRGEGMRRHARMVGAESGLSMEVHSDQPGVQVYTGNFLDGSLLGSYGHTYRQGAEVALETQHAPDSPNRSSLPSVVLRPGETYATTTLWKFGVDT